MATVIRAELSKKNKYYISKQRYYELKYYCLQKRNPELIKSVSESADPDISSYIFKAVTEGCPYTYLHTMMDIPCSRDMFYDRYRKFFWMLDKIRD